MTIHTVYLMAGFNIDATTYLTKYLKIQEGDKEFAKSTEDEQQDWLCDMTYEYRGASLKLNDLDQGKLNVDNFTIQMLTHDMDEQDEDVYFIGFTLIRKRVAGWHKSDPPDITEVSLDQMSMAINAGC